MLLDKIGWSTLSPGGYRHEVYYAGRLAACVDWTVSPSIGSPAPSSDLPPTVPPQPTGAAEQDPRQALEARRVPIQAEQRIGNLLVDADGHGEIYSGLEMKLGERCGGLLGQGTPEEETVCAASKVAGARFIQAASLALASGLIDAGLGQAGRLIELGWKGRLLWNAGASLFKASVTSETWAQVPADALNDFVKGEAAFFMGRATEDYIGAVADPTSDATADVSADALARLLDGEHLQTNTATEQVRTLSGTLVTATVAYAYNPYTHYVTAVITSNVAPGTVYALAYEVDAHGIPVSRADSRTWFDTYALVR